MQLLRHIVVIGILAFGAGACDSAQLKQGTGQLFGKSEKEDSDEDDAGLETDTEETSADMPADVAGAFLVDCAAVTEAPVAAELPDDPYGCRILEKETKTRVSGVTFQSLRLTRADGTSEDKHCVATPDDVTWDFYCGFKAEDLVGSRILVTFLKDGESHDVDTLDAFASSSSSKSSEHEAPECPSSESQASPAEANDACKVQLTEHRAFVTKKGYQPGEDFRGLADGDKICQAEAKAANIEGTFKVILSTSKVDARERLVLNGKVFVVDAQGVAYDVVAVAKAFWKAYEKDFLHAINFDPFGNDVGNANVFTGTDVSGKKIYGQTCNDWKRQGATPLRYIGQANQRDGDWTAKLEMTQSCASRLRLYCVQQ